MLKACKRLMSFWQIRDVRSLKDEDSTALTSGREVVRFMGVDPLTEGSRIAWVVERARGGIWR